MKFFKLVSFLTVLSLAISACGAASDLHVAQSNERRVTAPEVSSGDLGMLVKGNNAFAMDLYRTLPRGDGNLVLSPFSVSLALAMTYAGAHGDTAIQMANTLHFNLPDDRLHPAFNALDLELTGTPDSQGEDRQPLQLELANAVWTEQTYPIRPGYLDTLARNYGAGIHLADFVHAAEASRREINGWVSGQTNDRIKDLIPEGVITDITRLVLVNAIYFKADWLYPFDKNSTGDAPFHLLDGTQVQVPTMHAGMTVPYGRGTAWQAVELPYAGGTAVMDVILPDEGHLEDIETLLDVENLGKLLASLQPAQLQLALPKFKFSSQLGLVPPLQQLGMTDPFDPDRADFTGMTEPRELSITDIVHQAFVAVDEEGTEAAAATAVIVGVTSARPADLVVSVDRPFIFLIRNLQTGQILFVGRVTNPAQ